MPDHLGLCGGDQVGGQADLVRSAVEVVAL